MNELIKNTLRFIKYQNPEIKYIDLWNPKEKKLTKLGTILVVFVNISIVIKLFK